MFSFLQFLIRTIIFYKGRTRSFINGRSVDVINNLTDNWKKYTVEDRDSLKFGGLLFWRFPAIATITNIIDL